VLPLILSLDLILGLELHQLSECARCIIVQIGFVSGGCSLFLLLRAFPIFRLRLLVFVVGVWPSFSFSFAFGVSFLGWVSDWQRFGDEGWWEIVCTVFANM
jgi:hypothetical protein